VKPPVSTPLFGKTFDTYSVVSQLGEGGFGVVCKARDATLPRFAAVKILLPDVAADAAWAKRLLAEAQAASLIEHPNIVTVFRVGTVSGTGTRFDGSPYIAMELVNGKSLAERMEATRFTLKQAIEIARQVASAVAAAHEVGIVHRDLKPGNLMLAKDPAARTGERVKVLDFGIAKFSGEVRNPSLPTARGAHTPGYGAPEQIGGNAEPRSDVYSLGCILHEVVSGRPFMREPLADGSPELRALAAKMVALDPAQRPSMQEVVDELVRIADEVPSPTALLLPASPPEARPAQPVALTGGGARRNIYLAVVIALGLAAVGVGFGLLMRGRTPDDTSKGKDGSGGSVAVQEPRDAADGALRAIEDARDATAPLATPDAADVAAKPPRPKAKPLDRTVPKSAITTPTAPPDAAPSAPPAIDAPLAAATPHPPPDAAVVIDGPECAPSDLKCAAHQAGGGR
jgi:serine/threonine-protein kinase